MSSSFFFFYYFTEQIHISISLYYFLQLSSLDGSEEEERARLATKEEEDIDMLRSWMEVGGLPAHPEEEAKGLLTEVNSSPVFPMLPSSLYFLFVTNSSLTISGIGLLLAISSFFLGVKTASPGQQKARGGAETRSRGAATGNRGVGKAQGGCSGV